jgi:putative spermidine/putrescine transport system permease protein
VRLTVEEPEDAHLRVLLTRPTPFQPDRKRVERGTVFHRSWEGASARAFAENSKFELRVARKLDPFDDLPDTVDFAVVATLEVKVSVRRTCSAGGHASGVTRLWYNGQPTDSGAKRDAGSRLDAVSDLVTVDHFLRKGFVLSKTSGTSRQAIGVPAALCLARYRFRAREPLGNLLLLPLMVPGIVLGTSLYVFHVEASIATGLPILGSIAALMAGHVLIVIPWTVRLVSASLAGFDRSIEEAAQSLGAPPMTTFFRITLPTIRPGIVAGALFGFVTSFGNLEMSLFLVGAGRTTLPIAILQYLEWKIDPTIAAVSVLQILFIGGAMLLTDRFVKIGRVV